MQTSHSAARQAKYELILDRARIVFCRQGFASVTMQDIIDECGISRGGIYLYFSSIEQIFKEVVLSRERKKFETIRNSADNSVDFRELFDHYLFTQKTRLLNMDDSLLRAVYEYHFTHKSEEDIAFRDSQVQSVRQTIEALLQLGKKQNYLAHIELEVLRDHIMIMIEGLSVYALLGGLTETNVDEQFEMVKRLVYHHEEA